MKLIIVLFCKATRSHFGSFEHIELKVSMRERDYRSPTCAAYFEVAIVIGSALRSRSVRRGSVLAP